MIMLAKARSVLRLALLLLYLSQTSVSAWASYSRQSKEQKPMIQITFRRAVLSDLDDITDTFIEAFSRTPLWNYLYPWRHQYADYHRACIRQEIQNRYWLRVDDNISLNVITVSDQHSRNADRVVSLSFWEFLSNTTNNPTPKSHPLIALPDCSSHLDMNITRAISYDHQFTRLEHQYIDDVYPSQLYLAALATHPDWEGNGFGAMQCEWGMRTAREREVPVTLIATPVGLPLYQSLGFENIANISIEFLDGLGGIWYEVMKFVV